VNKQSVYQVLPSPLKNLAASVWGYYLRHLRFDHQTETLVEEALQRESWDRNQWEKWQQVQLARLLQVAATTVPYYREQWQRRRRNGDKASWELLQNWPILDKKEVRDNPRAFLSENSKSKHLYTDHTGGTTGKPTLIFESREVIRNIYALHEARTRRWFGVHHRDRWGMLGGQKVIPLHQRRPPYWVWNGGLNQVYFSVFHINPETAKDYVRALWKYRPVHLMVYPSSCAILSKFILEQRLRPPQIKVIVCNSENTLPKYRELMTRAFNCPVIDTYGMAEACAAASECLALTQHYWPESGIIEVFDPQKREFNTEPGTAGEYVLTGLMNDDMPLVRYANHDLGYLPNWQHQCACERKLPSLASIAGRSNDLVLTKDGRELYILDSLYNGLPVIEGQLIQHTLDSFEVKVVPDETYSRSAMLGAITARLQQYLGAVNITLTEVTEIEKNANGKFKPFVSMINAQTYR